MIFSPPRPRLAIAPSTLDQVFFEARTFKFNLDPVTDGTLKEVYELMKWGPTSVSAQPGRYVFWRTPEAKQRLKPALAPGNVDKTMAASVVFILATDSFFHEFLSEPFRAFDAKAMFTENASLSLTTAQRNGALQGACVMVSPRLVGLDCGPMSGFDASKVDA